MNRKSLLESLVLIARQPDQGNNIYSAEWNIAEHLKPLALNNAALTSELEWMHETVGEMMKHDPSVAGLFRVIREFIESRLRLLDVEEPLS